MPMNSRNLRNFMITTVAWLTDMLAVTSSTGCLNGWTRTTSSWRCWRRPVYCITKHRAALHSAALLGSCTARISDQCTTSRWYGDCSCYADSWNASNISSGSIDTFAAHRTILVGRVAVAAVFTVTDRDKVHRSAAFCRQRQLIQQVGQWCPVSINLTWMLPRKKHSHGPVHYNG